MLLNAATHYAADVWIILLLAHIRRDRDVRVRKLAYAPSLKQLFVCLITVLINLSHHIDPAHRGKLDGILDQVYENLLVALFVEVYFEITKENLACATKAEKNVFLPRLDFVAIDDFLAALH